ncbi:MAG: Acetolactate synthase small subunit [Anaerolineae bacterium]|nr:Acetolactate synthase small subunit [Anaerolineae bacterium]
MKHTLVALVQDKPGVLNRVASLFRRRAFNIESLAVGHTDQAHISRMTIVIDSDNTNAHLVEANLAKLVNVLDVQDVTNMDTIFRDLALVKVRADAAARAEIAQLADIFRAKIVDVASDSVIVEVTGDEDKIEGLVELLRPKGILEMVRTGRIAMVRGNQSADRKNGNGKYNGNGHVTHDVGVSSV